jgi:membrane protein implicated in regulation of membrane protease activity
VECAVIALAIAAALLSILASTFTLVVLAMAIPSLLVTFLFVPHLARRSANAARRNRALLETFGSEGEAALRRAAVAERPSVSTSSARAPRRSA